MRKIQVWGCRLIRVTDHRVPRSCLCVETSSKQLPQGFVLCVTLICIIHHYILFCIVFICTQLHCIKHCCPSNFKALCCIIVPAMRSVFSATHPKCCKIPCFVLLLYFVLPVVCPAKMLGDPSWRVHSLPFQCSNWKCILPHAHMFNDAHTHIYVHFSAPKYISEPQWISVTCTQFTNGK